MERRDVSSRCYRFRRFPWRRRSFLLLPLPLRRSPLFPINNPNGRCERERNWPWPCNRRSVFQRMANRSPSRSASRHSRQAGKPLKHLRLGVPLISREMLQCEETIYINATSEVAYSTYVWINAHNGNFAGERSDDWRLQLHHESRKRMVRKITETLRRCLPPSVPQSEIEKIAMRFEEKIYSVASNQIIDVYMEIIKRNYHSSGVKGVYFMNSFASQYIVGDTDYNEEA